VVRRADERRTSLDEHIKFFRTQFLEKLLDACKVRGVWTLTVTFPVCQLQPVQYSTVQYCAL